MSTSVLVLVGSLREGSTNAALAHAVAHHAPEGVAVSVYGELASLPFYSDDLETAGAPASVEALRAAVGEHDAVLLVTPEYNGSLPAVLANAIDWLSRPYGAGAIKAVPSAVIGTSLGQYGGVWAQEIARRSLSVAGADVLDTVFLALPGSTKRFADLHPREDGEVADGVAQVLAALAARHADAVVPA